MGTFANCRSAIERALILCEERPLIRPEHLLLADSSYPERALNLVEGRCHSLSSAERRFCTTVMFRSSVEQ